MSFVTNVAEFAGGIALFSSVAAIRLTPVAAPVGVVSSVMAVSLQILGFSYKQHAITAVFAITGVGCLSISALGMIGYLFVNIAMARGNRAAIDGDW